jgi:outer membrane receptor protein involved in Fe transport
MSRIPAEKALFAGVIVVVALTGVAFAQPPRIDIPAEDLKTALDAYIKQAGVDLIYQVEDVSGLRSPGVRSTSSNMALDELLKGSGAVAHRDPSGAVIVSRAQELPRTEAIAEPSLEAVIVTGSRVIRTGDVSPTPLTIVDATELAATTPSNVPDALNKLPMFQGSRNQRTTGGATINWPGNFLNLRDFGINRTLILLDGRRVPYTDMSGDVDVNTLPLALMERVDVVTGGASAVYGSDAITGVVNFVLNHRFDGLKASLQAGLSNLGDAGSWKAGLVGGTDFQGGRGHAEFSYEHYRSNGIDGTPNRPFSKLIPSELGAGTAASPYRLALNTRNTSLTPGGYIGAGALANMFFASNGVLTPFTHGLQGNGVNEVGGDGGYAGQAFPGVNANPWLVASLTSDQLFGRLDYQLTPGVEIYLQANVSQSSNYGVSFVQQKSGVFAIDNAFLPASAAATLAAAGQSSFSLSRSFQNESGTISASYTAGNNVSAGAGGTVFGHYDWEAHYTYGKSVLHEKSPGVINQQRMTAALDAVQGPSGAPVCRVSLTAAGAYPGCVPFDAFGPTSESAAAWAYIHDDIAYKATNAMHDLGGNIHGAVFENWAGPVMLSLDIEHREVFLSNASRFSPTALVNCANLNPVTCNPALAVWNGATANFPTASEAVSEGAVEVNVPLLHGLPWAQAIDFNGAARYTEYSISGAAMTWKGGLVWDVGGGLFLRGTASRDIRAPTLSNLFAPVSANYTAFTDYLTGISDQTTTSTQGNSNLKPEVARTNTFGFVYKPDWLSGFGLTADYYQISINNVITSIKGGDISSEQVCIASGGVSPYCALVIRPFPITNTTPANFPTRVLSESLNAGKLNTHGIDAEAEYSFDLARMDDSLQGMMGLRMLVAYQPSLQSVSPVPNAPVINQAGAEGGSGISVASGRVTLNMSYASGPLTVSAQERWHSSERQDPNPTVIYADRAVPQIFYTDLTVSYDFGLDRQNSDPDVVGFLTIENFFDRQPDIYIAQTRTGAQGYTYPAPFDEDVVGRFFTAGIRLRL